MKLAYDGGVEDPGEPGERDEPVGIERVGSRAAPRFELARSLADARPTSLVYVDRKGQVRSPARYRAAEAASYAALASVIAGFTAVYGSMFGAAGVAAGGLLAGLFGWRIRQVYRLRRAALLVVHDRVEEAIPILERIARSRSPRRLRAMAEQNLGAAHARRGRYEEALAHQRRAIELHGARARSRPPVRAVQYAEVVTLVNLGRIGEARARFLERSPRAPEGDYLRMQHWVAELYLALAGADLAFDEDDLHERARAGLRMTGGAALLGLTAWAHHRAGDVDQSWHLLREALDRPGEPIERSLPRLHAWMQAHAAEARAAGPDAALPEP